MKFRLNAAYFCFVLVLLSFSSPADATPKNTIVGTVVVGAQALGIVVSPDSRYVYVADRSSNTVAVIDTSINRVMASIPAVPEAQFLAISPDGQRLFVSSYKRPGHEAELAVISTSTRTVIGRIVMGKGHRNFTFPVVRPGGNVIYASNPTGISVIETANYQLIGKIELGGEPSAIVFTPNGEWAYVAYFKSGVGPHAFIALIDCWSWKVLVSEIAQGSLPKPGETGFFAGLAITPSYSPLYVIDNESASSNTIEAINLDNKSTVSTLYSAPSNAYIIGESMTPDGQYLYTLMENPAAVVTVALSSGSVIGQPISVGFGGAIAIAPDGNHAYVSGVSKGQGIVTIIDISPQ